MFIRIRHAANQRTFSLSIVLVHVTNPPIDKNRVLVVLNSVVSHHDTKLISLCRMIKTEGDKKCCLQADDED